MELFLKYRAPLYLTLSVYSSISYFYMIDIYNTATIICGFIIIDTIYNKDINTKPDYLIHHLLTLTCYGSLHYYKYYEFAHVTIYPLISFQVSSIFLSLNELCRHNYYYNKYKYINLILFLLSFIYFRLYSYYYILINPDLYIFLNKYNIFLIVIPYSYYLLNMYWVIGIIKKIIFKG